MTFGLIALALAWKFVAPDAPSAVALEWKRVLESPLSAAVRREIPAEAAPALANINFIEGIERVVWTPGLAVLEGSFDLERLKDMAVADGGVVKTYKKADLLCPGDEEGTHVGLIGPSLILLGGEDLIKSAIDRAEKSKATGPAGFNAYDLWVRTSGPGFRRHEFSLQLLDQVWVSSKLLYASEESAQIAADNASFLGLAVNADQARVTLSGRLSRSDFEKRTWRSSIESLESEGPFQPAGKPGVVRIYGLDGGVKEVPIK